MTIKNFCSHGNSLFSSPHSLNFKVLVIFSLQNKAINLSQHIYMLVGSWKPGTICKYQNGTPKSPEMPLILGRSGTQCVAMATKLLSSYCGAHLVESYFRESNISDTNWLRYFFSSYSIKIWLSVWCHHWANLHILKTWITLEWKEIFENSKQHFTSHTGYLFMF